MSSKLIKALAKVLEEVLTRELALVLGHITSRIKALIPVIIQKCRTELMRASTLSTGSSHHGSSDGDLWSGGSPMTSQSSRSSWDIAAPREAFASTSLFQCPESLEPDNSLLSRASIFNPTPQVAAPYCESIETIMGVGCNDFPTLPTAYQSNTPPVDTEDNIAMCMDEGVPCPHWPLACKTAPYGISMAGEQEAPLVWDSWSEGFDFEKFS
jgi:hypothetical protein